MCRSSMSLLPEKDNLPSHREYTKTVSDSVSPEIILVLLPNCLLHSSLFSGKDWSQGVWLRSQLSQEVTYTSDLCGSDWEESLEISLAIYKPRYTENFFFFFFFFLLNMVEIKYYVSFKCAIQWFHIYRHFEVIIISLAICPLVKSLQYYWPYSFCCLVHLCSLFI